MDLPKPRLVAFLVMLCPALVGLIGLIENNGLLCSGRIGGTNIEHALKLASGTALVAAASFLVLIVFSAGVSRWHRVVAVVCVAEAAVVAVAIAFVAFDSAKSVATDCGIMSSDSEPHDLSWLYVAWGVGVAALLYVAVCVERSWGPERVQPESEPEAEVVGLPQD
jgi:hypothetical protein